MAPTGDKSTPLAPIRKQVTIRKTPQEAFRVFFDRIAEWWPLDTHSVDPERVDTCAVEGRVGGRIYESYSDGSRSLWGTVRVWDPPNRVVFSWHPGRDAGSAQEVEVRFKKVDEGTDVSLEHRGWETLKDRAADMWNRYDTGWDYVFGARYAETAS
jgi:hypothetical protein